MTDTLYTNGYLYFGEGRFERGSLLMRGDRIEAIHREGDGESVGDAPGIGDRVGAAAAADVVDLRGGTLLPGFQDAHVHPLIAGMQLLGIDLYPVHDRAEYLRIIRAYADANPDEPVLVGGGWFGDVFDGGFPTAAELDAVVSDRPVVLYSHDGHGMWVNSNALDAAAIDRDTPDPSDGRIVRDEQGNATGVLLEGAASLGTALAPDATDAVLRDALLAAQERLHSVGVTAWQDAAVGESEVGPDPLAHYEELDRTGQLTARVVTALWWNRHAGLEQIDEFVAIRERLATSNRLDANSIKVMIDGMVENRTAGMLEPFDGHPGDAGLTFIDADTLTALTVALDAKGFQVHFHAVGDGAVRSALDALEVAQDRNGPSSNRHHIAHLDIVHPDDVARFAELNVTANVSALWARTDEEIVTRKLPLIGERSRHHFPFASITRAGARLVGGSDWPVTDPNPLWAIKTAVTRTGLAEDPHAVGEHVFSVPLVPEEAISYAQALDAYLSEAAFINRLDEHTGSLRRGALADLVWIDRDLRDIEALGEARVLRTVVGGETVYSAE